MTPSGSPVTPPALHRIPWATLLLCIATLTLSVHAAIEVSGSWSGAVRIVDLEAYGLRFGHLRGFELWRLVTAQLVHVKHLHMLGDVVCLAWVGAVVERRVGAARLLALWLVGGTIAMLLGTLTVPYPWNLGTGSSQAIMAISGAGLWWAVTGLDRSRSLLWPVGFTIALALAIDVVHVLHPKVGHVAGVLIGMLIAARMRAPHRG